MTNMKINKLRLLNRRKYTIVNSENYNSENDFLDAVALSLEQGSQIIQLCEKHFNDKKTIELGKKVRELCSIYGALFIIWQRADLVQILNADGIHLDENSISIHMAKELLGENIIIGKSINTEEEITNAIKNDADYIFIKNTVKTYKIPHFIYNEIKKI